jgi:hypothetical protein
MKLRELFIVESSMLDVNTLSAKALAKMHGVSEEQIVAQIAKGIKVELEHTSNKGVAKEIAMDHIKEMPDYYDKLQKMERNQ